MGRRVEEARREEQVIVVSEPQHVETKEVAGEAFSDASFFGIDKSQRVDGERRPGGHDGLVDGLCVVTLVGLEDVFEVLRRDEEDADVREALQEREEVELVLGRDGR